MDCELQIPKDWWGRQVFSNVNEPPIRCHLPQTELDSRSSKPLGYFFGKKNIDLFVYAQHQVYIDFYSRRDVRDWLRFRPRWEEYRPTGLLSSYHVRRGDYVTHPVFSKKYCVVSLKSYERAIEKFNIPAPIRRVQEGLNPPGHLSLTTSFGWMPDFLALRDSQHLLRANSSFSLWAGWLGWGKVYSPVVGNKVGEHDVDFVEGNHENTAGIFPNQSNLYLKE